MGVTDLFPASRYGHAHDCWKRRKGRLVCQVILKGHRKMCTSLHGNRKQSTLNRLESQYSLSGSLRFLDTTVPNAASSSPVSNTQTGGYTRIHKIHNT